MTAYVAFDMDNTLGFMEIVAPIGRFFSYEFLSNPEEAPHNAPLQLSSRLRSLLSRAQRMFAAELLNRPELLDTVLRPNIDSLIEPILKAKKRGVPVTVIIYSNTGSCFCTHLMKLLLESRYKAPGLIKSRVDVFHPLRAKETPAAPSAAPGSFRNPDKTFPVLARLLQSAARTSAPIHPESVVFIDDRDPLHRLTEVIPEGLTYIKPVQFSPRLRRGQRDEIFGIALEIMDRIGLFSDMEYMHSGICFRRVRYGGEMRVLRGFPDLFSFVWESMNERYMPVVPWRDDGAELEAAMNRFLRKF
jgi:hypothetical protein